MRIAIPGATVFTGLSQVLRTARFGGPFACVDLLALAGYIDPALPGWIEVTRTVVRALDSEPRA